MATFEQNVDTVLGELKEILLAKNEKYGNSALEPVRVFSKASAKEQILVRLDDKLSRLRTQHVSEDEDVATDLMGYLVLLKIADLQSPDPTMITDEEFEAEINLEREEDEVIKRWVMHSRLRFEGRNTLGGIVIYDSKDEEYYTFMTYGNFFNWFKDTFHEIYIKNGPE